MSTGDWKRSFEKLKSSLKAIKYENMDEAKITEGNPLGFLPIFNYLFVNYSKVLGQYLVLNDFELLGKSDARFMEAVFRFCRDHLHYNPTLTPSQFFSSGFAERKVILLTDIIQACKGKITELKASNKKKKFVPTSVKTFDATSNPQVVTHAFLETTAPKVAMPSIPQMPKKKPSSNTITLNTNKNYLSQPPTLLAQNTSTKVVRESSTKPHTPLFKLDPEDTETNFEEEMITVPEVRMLKQNFFHKENPITQYAQKENIDPQFNKFNNVVTLHRQTDDEDEVEIEDIEAEDSEEDEEDMPLTNPPQPTPPRAVEKKEATQQNTEQLSALMDVIQKLTQKVESLETKLDSTVQNLSAKMVILEGKLKFVEEQVSSQKHKDEGKEMYKIRTERAKILQNDLKSSSIEYKKEATIPVVEQISLPKETTSIKSSSTPEVPRASTFLTSVPDSMLTRPTNSQASTSSFNQSSHSLQETQEVISIIAKRFKETQELLQKASSPNVTPSGRSLNGSGVETPSYAGNTSTLSYYSSRTNL